MRYAVINPEKIVVNVIIWDAVSNWEPPLDCILVKTDTGGIGDMYDMDTLSFITQQES